MQEIEAQIAKPGFWDIPEDTKGIMQERTRLSDQVDRFRRLAHDLEESGILLDLAVEESDAKTLEEAGKLLKSLDARLRMFSLDLMLDGDDAGRSATVRVRKALEPYTTVHCVSLPSGLDPDDLTDQTLLSITNHFFL